MTPGPTSIHEDVRAALGKKITNPDLDLEFYEFYKETCDKLKQVMRTKNDVLILSGEGILGLEAACASLVEPGDKVLCIDNGIFGNGFGDFLKMYGGDVTYFESDYQKEIDVVALEKLLEEKSGFKVATLVHCETPSGITNPVGEICKLLKKHGIITVVDSVSAIGGEPLEVDQWEMDIVLGGSQKCLSAPPGLTFLSISDDAWNVILNRKQPICGYYCNLSVWKSWYQDKWFPYTQPISDLYGFRVAVERVLEDEQFIDRHRTMAEAVRKSLVDGGLELYPVNGFSNTVTTVKIPEGVSYAEINETMVKEHDVMIAGAFGYLKDQVFRIGHMGENCFEEKIYLTLKALDQTLRKYNVELKEELHKKFVECR